MSLSGLFRLAVHAPAFTTKACLRACLFARTQVTGAEDKTWYADNFKTVFNSLSPLYSLKWPNYEPFAPTPQGNSWGNSYNYISNNILNYARVGQCIGRPRVDLL